MTEDARQDDDPVVRPGTPSFRCIADECGAMCCRNPYRVDLGEDEVARLATRVDVWEVVEERAAMILMRQDDDACVLLTATCVAVSMRSGRKAAATTHSASSLRRASRRGSNGIWPVPDSSARQ